MVAIAYCSSGLTYFYAPETRMLSAHEVATLMLVQDSADHTELDDADLDALVEQHLVSIENLDSGQRRPCVTARGGAVLDAIAQSR